MSSYPSQRYIQRESREREKEQIEKAGRERAEIEGINFVFEIIEVDLKEKMNSFIKNTKYLVFMLWFKKSIQVWKVTKVILTYVNTAKDTR